MPGTKAPLCCVSGCDNTTPKRTNWHAMSDNMAADADPYHHRCAPHYAAWLVRDVVKWTKARKVHRCVGCDEPIAVGEDYRVGRRSNGLRYADRVAVCRPCAWGRTRDALEPTAAPTDEETPTP